MHSKVGDLRAQSQHDHPAKLVVTETAVLCARNIVTYLLGRPGLGPAIACLTSSYLDLVI